MTAAPPPGGDPEGVDVDAAWAEIMAHWDEPAARPDRPEPAAPPSAPPTPAAPPTPPGELRRRRTDRPAEPPVDRAVERPQLPDGRGGTEADPLAEEHWTPPEPPPLPSGSWRAWRTWLPWVGVLGVPFFFLVVLVVRPPLPPVVVLVAVLGFVAGFVTLVLRLPSHREDDGDDGARL
ncbi:hypothetical protein SAMN06264364_12452 [Quadrisphaera granulorum]|uniref:Uncharacterized protein n=1 Tax=Quadrisphaera granulorum TaxID=317664 RepID=A0A315ZW80_9ACTN|nr:hypothetical protein [Quadrisphaera granulorum]PWJ49886.1 hypothetical protein BXY45_12452 [Quadrisphaera granulorum]SZE98094.1 hypothetical protein SAMN06264364_12452 [Quadrisphaera granulorum]